MLATVRFRLAALFLIRRLVYYNFQFIFQLVCLREMSETHRIRKKHFTNPYPDYTPDNAREIINGLEIRSDCRVLQALPEKWEKFSEQLKKYKSKSESVYTGTSGIAMVYLLKDPKNPENLKRAKELLKTSGIKVRRRPTFLCGDGGPLALGAIVAHNLNQQSEYKNLIKALLSLGAEAQNYKSDLPNEYLYGRAGYLFALLYVNKHVCPPPVDETFIKSVIEAIIKSGRKLSKENNFKSPLMYEWHDSYYFGAAHGVSGIMYLLMQAKEYLTTSELNEYIRPTIDYLATFRYPSGNYPSSLESQSGDKYVQWCHGAPGFVYMFSMAYKVFNDPRYLELALSAGDVVWERGFVRKGYSICHGASGNGYCFLELFQTTKDVKHLYRAIKFAEWCVDYKKEHEEYSPDSPVSLYEGSAGPMYFLLDLQKPLEAKFPGYTL